MPKVNVTYEVEVTEIHPSVTRPVFTGVYLTHSPTWNRYSRWTGVQWMSQKRTPDQAKASIHRATHQAKPWQGLVDPVVFE